MRLYDSNTGIDKPTDVLGGTRQTHYIFSTEYRARETPSPGVMGRNCSVKYVSKSAAAGSQLTVSLFAIGSPSVLAQDEPRRPAASDTAPLGNPLYSATIIRAHRTLEG
jgi:hypothetical protein